MEVNQILVGDVLERIKEIPDQFVNCIVTSPPYWNLRDYGMCGQLGNEDTPEEFVESMTLVLSECKRILKKDGTLWLNIGDSYCSRSPRGGEDPTVGKRNLGEGKYPIPIVPAGMKPKDLIGIPWMLAFSLRSDGWYLRQDIIWSKPNPMPESVKDRCTKAHEYIFLMSKSKKYYYDSAAVKTKSDRGGEKSYHDPDNEKYQAVPDERWKDQFDGREWGTEGSANKKSVWSVPTYSYKGAHFATFPPKLIIPCILAGCPEDGVVFDPFMGAGTTALVARKLNRNYLGIELNPEYVEIAEKRLRTELGLFQ